MPQARCAAREAAIAAGRTTYQGRPCRHGHSGLRYVSTHQCVTCNRDDHRREAKHYSALRVAYGKRYDPDQSKQRATQARYRKKHAEALKTKRNSYKYSIKRAEDIRLLYYEGH